MKLALLVVAVALAAGCQCGFDSSKLDDLECSSDADCAPDQDCVVGMCTRRSCDTAADCGDDSDYRCDRSFCWADECGADDPCADDSQCVDGFCRRGTGDGGELDGGGDGTDAGADSGPSCERNEDCDDGLLCTGVESCVGGACQAGTPPDCSDLEVEPCDTARCSEEQGGCILGDFPCDDGQPCTIERCEAEGCSYDIQAATCFIDGACRAPGDRDPQNGCQGCDPARSQTQWSTVDGGEGPSDGIDCTADGCSQGVPTHSPDDGLCGAGAVCALCAGGCVSSPRLTVSCPDAPVTPNGPGATCTIGLGSAGQAACLSCGSLSAMTSILRETFDGCAGQSMEQRGWTVSGTAPTCPGDANLGPDPATAEDHIQWDSAANSSIERTISTLGFDTVRLCFDYADLGMTSGGMMSDGDSLDVSIDTGGGWSSDVYRNRGGPIGSVDQNWATICVDLDAAAADNPALGIRFAVDITDATAYVDNISVDAWHSGDISRPGRVFTSSFTNCDLGTWVAGGPSAVECPIAIGMGGRDALGATNGSWTLTRSVDLSNRCDDVEVGFSVGTAGGDANDRMVLSYDRGTGSIAAWSSFANPAGNGTLGPFAFNLSRVDPAVRFQASLGLTFSLTSDAGDSVYLDDLWVDGAVCESGDGRFDVGAVVDAGNGTYTVTVGSAERAAGYLECTWDGQPATTARGRFIVSDEPDQ